MVISRPLSGLLFAVAASLTLPLLNASVKYLSDRYPLGEIIGARFIVHVLIYLALFVPRKGWRVFRTQQPGTQVLRSLTMIASTLCYFSAVAYIPLTTAAAIGFTAPFLVVVLSVPLLGETVGIRRVLATVFGFAGVLLIIRPGYSQFPPEGLLVFGMVLGYSLYQILTRRTSFRDSVETNALYTVLAGVVVGLIMLSLDWRWPVNLVDGLVFAGLGVWGGLGHLFMVMALHRTEASILAPIAYVQLIGATILGFLIFDHLPDLYTWFGIAAIIGGGLYVAWRERQRGRQQKEPYH